MKLIKVLILFLAILSLCMKCETKTEYIYVHDADSIIQAAHETEMGIIQSARIESTQITQAGLDYINQKEIRLIKQLKADSNKIQYSLDTFFNGHYNRINLINQQLAKERSSLDSLRFVYLSELDSFKNAKIFDNIIIKDTIPKFVGFDTNGVPMIKWIE